MNKYAADYDILTKDQAKERWTQHSNGSGSNDSKWMKPAPAKEGNDIPW